MGLDKWTLDNCVSYCNFYDLISFIVTFMYVTKMCPNALLGLDIFFLFSFFVVTFGIIYSNVKVFRKERQTESTVTYKEGWAKCHKF